MIYLHIFHRLGLVVDDLVEEKRKEKDEKVAGQDWVGLQESQIGDGDGEFGIIYAQVSFLLLPVDIPC